MALRREGIFEFGASFGGAPSPARAARTAAARAAAALAVLGFVLMTGFAQRAALPLAGDYVGSVLASRPIGYWRLGESSRSQAAADASGGQHVGVYHGAVQLGQRGAIAADADTAAGFGGPQARSYVEIADSPAFSIATSGEGLSLEVWMRPDRLDFTGENRDPNDAYIHWLGKGQKDQYEWGLRFYNSQARRRNRISAYVWNAEGKLGAGAYLEEPLFPGQWMHIVATFDDPGQPNARVRIYKDGRPSPHNNSPGTLYANYAIRPAHGQAPLRLGTRDGRSFLTGGLDEAAVYPRVLGPDEIRAHWLSATR